jgi:hypothetical protein
VIRGADFNKDCSFADFEQFRCTLLCHGPFLILRRRTNIVTVEKSAFVPNCVFIPASAVSDGQHVDPEDATLLMLEGDNVYGQVFTKEAWELGGEPSFIRRIGKFFNADEEESPIDEDLGRVELLPELCVVKIDERDYWCDPVVLARTTRIVGVYVFDRRQHVHICSFTPCYELHFLGSQWEEIDGLIDEEHDELSDQIIRGDGQSEPVTYWDKHEVDSMLETACQEGCLPSPGRNGGFVLGDIVSVTTEDALAEAAEAYSACEF